jgi:hypothetical protein
MKNIAQLLAIAFCLLIISCKKDTFITSTNATLTTSVDSLYFDTVFTTTGSVTQSFKINNTNNQKLKLSTVKLLQGTGSSFKMNVNGISATQVNDIDIEANDSIYVFVTVQIDHDNNNLPFIVTDSIQVSYNGNDRYIPLQAYGQNAVFLKDEIINGNVNWSNDLPYVILGSLRINTDATLTISEGCKVFVHADAPVIVDGSLIANGTKDNPVLFTGDRLDADYKDLPASLPGIYFRGDSKNNILTYAIIKNATEAIVAEQPSVNANPKVVLHQCIIDNAFKTGILCINSSLKADNCLISNCGSNISVAHGGNYEFVHCTVASISNNFITHKNPVLSISNFATQNGNTVTADLDVTIRNCIFWGDAGFIEDEIVVNKQGATSFNIIIENSLYKATNDPANTVFSNVIKNQDPLFDSINVNKGIYNFRINNPAAPGIDQGVPTGFLKDLDNNNRNIGLPDLGCYEKQ